MNAAANTSARAEARLAERVDARELAVEARIVEAVADDEPVGDDEAGEVDLHVHLASGGSVEQRCHPQGRRPHAPETPEDRVDRSAGRALRTAGPWLGRHPFSHAPLSLVLSRCARCTAAATSR